MNLMVLTDSIHGWVNVHGTKQWMVLTDIINSTAHGNNKTIDGSN